MQTKKDAQCNNSSKCQDAKNSPEIKKGKSVFLSVLKDTSRIRGMLLEQYSKPDISCK